MTLPYFSPKSRIERRQNRDAKHVRQLAKRELRREAKRDRPNQGAPIDWSASTTGAQQFPSAFPNTHPDVVGIGRTLSRGLR
jgi:hypothetical protein